MDDALAAVALLLLACLTLAVVLGPPVLLVGRGVRARLPLALWVAAMALLAVWVLVEVQAAVRADEEGTGGNIFAPAAMAWWSAALALGAAAASTAWRASGTPSRPAAQLAGACVLVAVAALVVLGPFVAVVLLPLLVLAQYVRTAPGRRDRAGATPSTSRSPPAALSRRQPAPPSSGPRDVRRTQPAKHAGAAGTPTAHDLRRAAGAATSPRCSCRCGRGAAPCSPPSRRRHRWAS